MTDLPADPSIMPQPLIDAQKLSKSIQREQHTQFILDQLDLKVYAGENIAITGRSGSGKSTLLGLLATLDQASAGQLWVCGQAVHELSEEQRAALRLKHIGFVFQSFQLLAHLTALDNVILPLRLQKNFHYASAQTKALELLEQLGLSQQALQTPKVLSGGEQQRVAIARALITEPQLIFADEPTGNLDLRTAKEIEKLLFSLHTRFSTTLVLVTHHLDLAAQCQQHYELQDGKLIQQQRVRR